jgi:hypothetical protein
MRLSIANDRHWLEYWIAQYHKEREQNRKLAHENNRLRQAKYPGK